MTWKGLEAGSRGADRRGEQDKEGREQRESNRSRPPGTLQTTAIHDRFSHRTGTFVRVLAEECRYSA